MRRHLTLLFPILLLGGCASLQRLAAAAFTPPRLHFQQATVGSVDLDGATVLLAFTVENPNDVSVQVASATWRLQAEGAEVSEGDLPGGLTLPARATIPFTVKVPLRWADLTRLAGQVQQKSELAYLIDGAIGVETPVGLVTLPYRHHGQLPVPRLPALRLVKVTASLSSLTALELGLVLEVENPNGFPLPGATLRFDLLVNDVPVASGREATLEPLGSRGAARLTVPVRISIQGAERAVAALRGGGGEVRLRGTVRAGGLETPLDLKLDLGRH
jgi:LEA14-like dessication related protein